MDSGGDGSPIIESVDESSGESIGVSVPQELSLTQRMMSASLGSILTAFVLTPFDVIRIRMQQQEIMPESYPCCADRYPEMSNGGMKNTLANKSISKMSTSSAISPNGPNGSVSSVHPHEAHLFWIDKEYCKNINSCGRINSTFQGFFTIGRNEGLPTLWRGMSLTLLMAIPANVIYFTGYEYIRDKSPINGSINSLICGSLARLLAATSVSPIELVKTRLQSVPSSKSNPKVFENVLRGTWDQVKARGVSSLFTGLQITLWRDVPFSGIYWSLYELTKSKISTALEADFNSTSNNSNNNSKVFLTSFLSGSISGTISAICTHPFDVGKTRLQISEDDFRSTKQPSMFKFLLNIWRNEGIGNLFGGLGPRVMKVAPSCAIMISTYEISKKFFKYENQNNS